MEDNDLIAWINNLESLGRAILVKSESVTIKENVIIGGIEVQGGSEKVTIQENLIIGASLEGITLGTYLDYDRNDVDIIGDDVYALALRDGTKNTQDRMAFIWEIIIAKNEICYTTLGAIGNQRFIRYLFGHLGGLANSPEFNAFYELGNTIYGIKIEDNLIHNCLRGYQGRNNIPI